MQSMLSTSSRKAAFLGSKLGASTSTFSLAPRKLSPAGARTITCAWGDLPNVGGGRKWEYLKTNENGKVPAQRLHVKKGDFVMVIAGKDKGKTGTIKKVDPKRGEIIVEGVNIKTKHIAPVKENEQGQIKKEEAVIHHSNVQHFSKEKNLRSRIGHKSLENGRKVRYLVKTGEIID